MKIIDFMFWGFCFVFMENAAELFCCEASEMLLWIMKLHPIFHLHVGE